LHPLQARQDATRCESCHRYQSFCVACHERTGVGLSADSSLRPVAPNENRVHPPKEIWVGFINPGHHGIAANRDLRGCVSCHREKDCVVCHSDADKHLDLAKSSLPVNPHPAGFARACRALAAKNDRPCLICHSEVRLLSLGCR
jgi:hypothetical protein